MEYLKVATGGEFSQVKGIDPEEDSELLQAVLGGDMNVFRYRGNQFEYLIVEDNGSEDEPDFDCTWEAA